jgi:hypothetical protein
MRTATNEPPFRLRITRTNAVESFMVEVNRKRSISEAQKDIIPS